MNQVSLLRLSLLTLLISGVFFFQLGGARLWDRDEPRNSRASQEMLHAGDWIVPTFNAQLRDHKPVLLYWGQMLSYLAIGESEFSARLPSALCALLSVLTVAVLASRLSGKPRGISPEGYWAAGALGTCLLFVMAGRAATPDACLILFSTLGIAALVLASLAGAPPYSSGRVAKARWLPAMFGYLMLGLAALAKGPVGIVLPLGVVGLWWMICHRLQVRDATGANQPVASSGQSSWAKATLDLARELWLTFQPLELLRAVWQLKVIPGLLLALLAAVPWYYAVGVATNGAFLRGFFLDHNVGRAMGSMEGHGGSVFFYPIAFLVGTFPWSMWFVPILLWASKAAKQTAVSRQVLVLAGAWIGIYLTAFTIAQTKLPSYITPCYAGAALAIGVYLRQFESGWSLPSRPIRWIAYSLTIAVGVAICGVIAYLAEQERMPGLLYCLSCGVVITLLGAAGMAYEMLKQTERTPLTWLCGAAVFQMLLFGLGASTVDNYRQDLALLDRVQEQQASEHWLSIGGMEPSWVYYLDCTIHEVTASENSPESWRAVADFLDEHPQGRLIVVGDQANQQLSGTVSPDEHAVAEAAALCSRLEVLDEAPRFLRPGNLVVYQGLATPPSPSYPPVLDDLLPPMRVTQQPGVSQQASARQAALPLTSSPEPLDETSNRSTAAPSLDLPSLEVPSLDVPSLDVPSLNVPSLDVPMPEPDRDFYPNPLRPRR